MRIPMSGFGNVTPDARKDIAQIGNVGATAAAVGNLTGSLDKAADLFDKQNIERNQNELQQKLLQIDNYLAQAQNDPNNGLFSLQGENAAGATERYTSDYYTFADKLMGELPDSVREQFQAQAVARGIQFKKSGLAFENKTKQEYEAANFNAVIENSSTRASMLGSDNKAYELETGATRQNIAVTMKLKGHSDEEIKAAVAAYDLQTNRKTVENNIGSDYVSFMLANGEPSDIGGVSRAGSKVSRGVNNNNPGNIRNSNNNWAGQVGSDGEFVQFATPEHGIRALGKNLLTYQRNGFDNVEAIINRWAPPSENETSAYVSNVSQRMGVTPTEQLDLTDIGTLSALTKAIIHHENDGASYTDEQVNSGLSAALGFSSLEGTQSTTTGNGRIYATPSNGVTQTVAFRNLPPADQAKYLKLAESMANRDKSALQDAMRVRLRDTYAALDNGLEPHDPPSDRELLDVFGGKAPQIIAELRLQERHGAMVALGSTLTPKGRKALLSSAVPTPSEGPDYAVKEQQWDKLGKTFAAFDEQYERQQAAMRLDMSLQTGFPLDPTDPRNQTAADELFNERLADNFDINDPNSVNNVALISSRAGLIPTPVKSILTTGATSNDPSIVTPIASMFGQIFDNNPAAVKEVPAQAQAYYSKVYALTRSGLKPDQAVSTAYKLTYEQDDRSKALLNERLRDKDYIKDRSKAAQKFVSGKTGWFERTPDVSKPGLAHREFETNYQVLFDTNFMLTGGDTEQAKKLTDAQINNVWAVSDINGSNELMKYAPEALYGVGGGAGNWIKGQWESEKKELAKNWFGGMPSNADFVLVPDALTPRDQSYSIWTRTMDADGVIQHSINYDTNGLPTRFKPDQRTSPMYLEIIERQAKTVGAARASRAANSAAGFYQSSPYSQD